MPRVDRGDYNVNSAHWLTLKMKTIEQSHGYSSLLPLDFVATESYDQLLQNAHTIAALNGVPTGVEETTFDLLDTLRTHDEKTAKECLQTLPLALQVGDILGNFTVLNLTMSPFG